MEAVGGLQDGHLGIEAPSERKVKAGVEQSPGFLGVASETMDDPGDRGPKAFHKFEQAMVGPDAMDDQRQSVFLGEPYLALEYFHLSLHIGAPQRVESGFSHTYRPGESQRLLERLPIDVGIGVPRMDAHGERLRRVGGKSLNGKVDGDHAPRSSDMAVDVGKVEQSVTWLSGSVHGTGS